MGHTPRFLITDVFGETKYSGNQLATILECAGISSEEMQQIAREINFSETTFVVSEEPRDGGYDVRIFTPANEIDFAGHPTLGTAFVIQKQIIRQPVDRVVLNLRVGQVPVRFPSAEETDDTLWMDQVEPTFGEVLPAELAAELLGLEKDDIDTDAPSEQVSTGLPFAIIPLRTMDALKRATAIKERYWDFVKDAWAKGILVFCPEGYSEEQDLGVRVFVDYYGVPEDPATGSANGCLAAYLIKNRYFGESAIDILTGQGYEIGRPSRLSLRGGDEGGRIQVSVGGSVIPVAEGRWGWSL